MLLSLLKVDREWKVWWNVAAKRLGLVLGVSKSDRASTSFTSCDCESVMLNGSETVGDALDSDNAVLFGIMDGL